MMDMPRPAPWMHLHYLDDGAVVYCASDASLHALNHAGALIWSLLLEGHDEVAAGAELARIGGLAPPRAAQFVADALAQWRQRGFLAGTVPPPPRAGPLPGAAVTAARPGFIAAAERSYRLLGTSFAVRYARASDAAHVDPVLAHLAAATTGTSVAIDVVTAADGLAVYQDGLLGDTCTGPAELAPVVKSLVWLAAVNRTDYFLNIHAGVVGDGSGCLLLPAAAGSGKSTLCALMMARGYRLLSDEVALLQRASLRVVPVPLALAIKDTGVDAIADELPEVRRLPFHPRHDGKRVAYLPPRALGGTAPLPVRSLVFPRFVAGAATCFAPLARAEALALLLEECVSMPAPLTAADVGALVGWMATLDCFRLEFGSGRAAVAALSGLLGPPPDRPE